MGFHTPTSSARERFPHPYKEYFILLPNRCGISQSTPTRPKVLAGTPPRVHPIQGSISSLTHRSMSGSNTICNSSSPPLVDIVLGKLFLKVFKTHLVLGRDFHTLIKKVSFSFPTNVDLTLNKPESKDHEN